MTTFIDRAHDEIGLAWAIVQEHSEAGENEIVSIEKMLPHGSQDLVYEVFKKACRMVGYDKKQNPLKVYQEAQDIINYCAFLLALIRQEEEDAGRAITRMPIDAPLPKQENN